MIESAQKSKLFRLASTHGPVTVVYDSQVQGVVQPAPRTRELCSHVFSRDAIVTADLVRTRTDFPLVSVPWSAVIAITLEEQGVLYCHDDDADTRRLNYGSHLRLVKGAA